MSFLGKEYVFYKHENFDKYLKFLGYPADKIDIMVNFSRKTKLVKNGDTYTLNSQNPEGPKEISFQSGVEFDDYIGIDKAPVKVTYNVSGDTITQTIKSPKRTSTIKYEYSGDEVVATITADNWDGVAKRFYKVI